MAKGFKETQKQLALNLRGLREAKGLSQERLALDAEVDRTYVSQIERGICNPSLRVLYQIAGALKVPVSALLSAAAERK